MALFKFTKNILENKPIDVYNHGNMKRDFTYVDDIVEGVVRALRQPAASDETWDGKNPNPAISYAPYRLYNIGNSSPTPLTEYIQTLELALGKKAIYNMMPMQAGDIASNYADTTRLQQDLDYKPQTTVAEGIGKFVEWYMGYYQPTELVKENGNKAHG